MSRQSCCDLLKMLGYTLIINILAGFLPLYFCYPNLQTDKIPPILLKPFRTTADIRYSQFLIPKSTITSSISFSLVIDKGCLPENFTALLRHNSLPLVMPFGMNFPPAVVMLSDFYAITVKLQENAEAEVLLAPTSDSIRIWSSKNNLFASIEVKIFTPTPGLWYFGCFFMDTSLQRDCKILMFVQAAHEILPFTQHTVVFSKLADCSPNMTDELVRSNYTESTSVTLQHHPTTSSTRLSNGQQYGNHIRTAVSTGVTDTNIWLRRRLQRRHSSRVRIDRSNNELKPVKIPLVSSTPSVVQPTRWPSESTYQINSTNSSDRPMSSLLTLHLNPLEGHTVEIDVLSGMTSIDMVLKKCSPILTTRTETTESADIPGSPLPPKKRRTTVDNRGSGAASSTFQCQVMLDTSISSLPSALASKIQWDTHVNLAQSEGADDQTQRNYTSSSSSSYGSSQPRLSWTPGKRYRFEAIQTPDVAHYLHVQNVNERSSVELTIYFMPHFGCVSDNELTRPHTRNRVQQLDPTSNATASNETLTRRPDWSLSLLPWINPSWPELTPERGRRRRHLRGNSRLSRPTETGFVVDPNDRAHQLLVRCSLWPAPSRIAMPQAFASHFTYQPNSGRYTSGFQLTAWQVVAIPVQLDARLDTGGTLEISLQLNAFAATRVVNSTHSEPLLRQVILHGCFARHITTSPFGFTDPKRCPLWLRLATDRGLAISVVHAISIAASALLSRDQPPHRSEVPPTLDTSFNEQVDRSFFYLPYPSPGQWYLSLYAECYPIDDPLCSQASAASIDVGLVMRLAPCLNYRCRDVGEGASLPPSRVLNASHVGVRPFHPQSSTIVERWRPPWWFHQLNVSNPRASPLVLPPKQLPAYDDSPLPGEGLCVELLQRSIFASTCACPPGRAGLGCMRFPPSVLRDSNRSLSAIATFVDELESVWTGHSSDAILLALSNLAFLPAICLTLLRRLWIPSLAYTYTMVFSALYHICDTDVMNIPLRFGANTIGGALMSFGGYALSKSRGYQLLGSEPSGYRSTSSRFRFTSPTCPLPPDVLSFCDFFGGVLSVWVTVVAATACPLRYAQLAYVMFVLSLTVAVQVARYSTGLFLIPCLLGMAMLIVSWTYRSRRTGRLFPPVQWWIISFFPGLLLAGTGLILFLSPWMSRDYTRMHSLWHICIGLSPIGLLPWPRRWRIALAKVVSKQTPLSCGGNYIHPWSLRDASTEKTESLRSHQSCSPSACRLKVPDVAVPLQSDATHKPSPIRQCCCRVYMCLHRFARRIQLIYSSWCDKLDVWLELDRLLDPVVARWPKLEWLLPNGYIPHRSRGHVTGLNVVNQTTSSKGSMDAVSETIITGLVKDSSSNTVVVVGENDA